MITYDDSDGWDDHVIPPMINSSTDPALDALNGPGVLRDGAPMGGLQDRCGLGPRLPLLVISPYAKPTTSRHDRRPDLGHPFIEDNWSAGATGDPPSITWPAADGHVQLLPAQLRALPAGPATGEPADYRVTPTEDFGPRAT